MEYEGSGLPTELVDAVVRMRPAPEWMLVCRATRAMAERAAPLYAFVRRSIEPAFVPVEHREADNNTESEANERARLRESRDAVRAFRDAVVITLAGPDPHAAVECVVRPALAYMVDARERCFSVWARQDEARIARTAKAVMRWSEKSAPRALHPLCRLRQLLAESFGRAGVLGPDTVFDLLPLRPVPRWRRRAESERGRPGLIADAGHRLAFARTKVEIAFVRGMARVGRCDAAAERLAASPVLAEVGNGARCTCTRTFGRSRSARDRLLRVLRDAARDRAGCRPPSEAFELVARALAGFRLGLCNEGTCSCDLDAKQLGAPIGRAIARWAAADTRIRCSAAGAITEIERVARALDMWSRSCRCAAREPATRRLVETAPEADVRRLTVLTFWTACARASARAGADPEVIGACCAGADALLPIPKWYGWAALLCCREVQCAAAFLVLSPSFYTRSEAALRVAGTACDLVERIGHGNPLRNLFVPDHPGDERPAEPSAEAAERAVAWACERWSPSPEVMAEIATGVPSGPCADAWDARVPPAAMMEECAIGPDLVTDRGRIERLIERCADQPAEWWRERVVGRISNFLSWEDSIRPELGPLGCCLRLLRPDLFSRETLAADMCCEGGCPVCADCARPFPPYREAGDPVSYSFGLPGQEVRGIVVIKKQKKDHKKGKRPIDN